MIAKTYKDMLSAKSVIRQLSEFATARGAEIGYENVFDFSLGNPSVPVPAAFTDTMIKLLKESNPIDLHGYSQSLGIPSVRAKIAASLNQRFGMDYHAGPYFYDCGRGRRHCPRIALRNRARRRGAHLCAVLSGI